MSEVRLGVRNTVPPTHDSWSSMDPQAVGAETVVIGGTERPEVLCWDRGERVRAE